MPDDNDETMPDDNDETPWSEPKELHLSREAWDDLLKITNIAKNAEEINKHLRTHPTNLLKLEELRLHMLTAHQMHPLSLQFYDESEHDHIPALKNRRRDWSGPTLPRLDHADLYTWHNHDHTEGEFASDYPHTTLNEHHFHHE
jgi:hypothetical protein